MMPALAPCSIARGILRSSLVLGLAIAASACEATSSTSTGPSPVKCLVSLEAPSDSIEPAGGKGAITVSAQPECSWTAASGASWITGLTPSSGQGAGRIEFDAAANPAGTVRQGHIAVNDQQIPVQQRPAACRFEVSPAAPTIDADGGTVALTVTTLAGCSWQASGEAGWVSMTTTSGTGSGSLAIRVAPNDGDPRSAALVVAGRTVTLTQSSSDSPGTTTPPPPGTSPPGTAPQTCVFSLDRSSDAVSAGGGSITVSASGPAGCSRTATSQAPWITVVAGAIGTGSGPVTFSVAANTAVARTGTLAIAGKTFTVGQASGCTYSINPTQQALDERGGSIAVAVSAGAGCEWTATSNESWIVISEGASGRGNGTVRFDVAPVHGGGNRRTGTLTIAGRTFTVDQDKKND